MPRKVDLCPGIVTGAFQHLHPAFPKLRMKHVHAALQAVRGRIALRRHRRAGKAFEHYNTALKINPNHKGANEYIGEAYLMSNNPVKAGEHLARLKAICGNAPCEEYEDLAKSIAAFKAKNN